MILLVYTHTDWNMWKLSVRCSSVSYVWLTKKSQKTLHLVSSQQAILDKTASFVDRKQLFSWKPVYRSMSKFVFSQFSKVKKLETGIIYVIKTLKNAVFSKFVIFWIFETSPTGQKVLTFFGGSKKTSKMLLLANVLVGPLQSVWKTRFCSWKKVKKGENFWSNRFRDILITSERLSHMSINSLNNICLEMHDVTDCDTQAWF